MGAELSRADGIKRFTVVNSHFHLDHVGGNETYRDDIIVASKGTLQTLLERKEAIEAGKFWGPPAVAPLVLPTRCSSAAWTS